MVYLLRMFQRLSTASLWLLSPLLVVLALCALQRLAIPELTPQACDCRIQASDRLCGTPSVATSTSDMTLAYSLYEGLYRLDAGNLAQPALAAEVTVDDEQREWTFRLRPSRWSNGQPVSAHDFCKAIRYRLHPEHPQPVAGQLLVVDGAQAYSSGTSDYLGVWAPDEHTLVIRWAEPQPMAQLLLCQVAFLPEYLEDETVVNGPFQRDGLCPGVCLQLRRNPLFWDRQRVQLETLQFLAISARHSTRLVEQNRLHWAGSPLGMLSNSILRAKHPNVCPQEAMATLWLRCNCAHGPLQSLKLRQKLTRLLFRNPLIANMLSEEMRLAEGAIPPALRHWPHTCMPDQECDVAHADQPLRLIYSSTGRWAPIAALIQQICNSAGIQVELQPREGTLFFRALRALDYDLGLSDLFADVGDAREFLLPFAAASNPANRTGWQLPEYQQLCASLRLLKGPELHTMAQRAEELLLEQAPIIPILHPAYYSLVSPQLQGVYINAAGLMELSYASLQ